MKQENSLKRPIKKEREREVLIGLIEFYLRTGTPVGSNTLKDVGFNDLSSATIRNYFADLETEGFLMQLHTSGGRIPTEKAYRLYATSSFQTPLLTEQAKKVIHPLSQIESPEVATYLERSAEILSQATNAAVFMMAPRFDHDFALDTKLVQLDHERALAVVITNFGLVHTEVLHSPIKLNSFRIKRIEHYFIYRLTGTEPIEALEPEESELAKQWYNEVMVRYVVGYSHFTENDIYKTGLSKLLSYPEIDSAARLAKILSLFENVQGMRLLLKECFKMDQLKFWIGKDLLPYSQGEPDFAVIAVPYMINQKTIGAVGILGPMRMPYKELFGTLYHFSEVISTELTKAMFKYRITFRQPMEHQLLLPHAEKLLLEDRSDT